jgi:CRISPR/Cas system-associated endonuclease Cas1
MGTAKATELNIQKKSKQVTGQQGFNAFISYGYSII